MIIDTNKCIMPTSPKALHLAYSLQTVMFANGLHLLFGSQLIDVIESVMSVSCYDEISDIIQRVLKLLEKKLDSKVATTEQMKDDTSSVIAFFWKCFWYYKDNHGTTPELDLGGTKIRAIPRHSLKQNQESEPEQKP